MSDYWKDYQDWTATKVPVGRPKQEAIEEWALGLIGEAGEVVELFKKERFHGRTMDREKLVSEIGDCLFYTARMLAEHGLLLEDPVASSVLASEHFLLLFLGTRSARLATEGASLDEDLTFLRPNEEAEEFKRPLKRTAERVMGGLMSLAYLRRITLEECAESNRRKLNARHPKGTDHDQAAEVKKNDDRPIEETHAELWEALAELREAQERDPNHDARVAEIIRGYRGKLRPDTTPEGAGGGPAEGDRAGLGNPRGTGSIE